MQNAPSLRYLWAYSAADDWTEAWHQRQLAKRRARGFDVTGFCVTPKSLKRRWLPFPELHRKWKMGDRSLLAMYQQLIQALEGKDVFILYNGANIHPDISEHIHAIKVYSSGDDPESTEILSKPLSGPFDIHLVNNISAIEMYQSWGHQRVHFWPLGSITDLDDVAACNEQTILTTQRQFLTAFIGENNSLKRARLNHLAAAFPNAQFAGRGWPRGTITWSEMWAIYQQTQIGWNIHCSTGPINFRTYDLPAHGILQICDNKKGLGSIYKLGEEAIGFDTINECIELTQHYLAHPEEQRKIAAAGWTRWKENYSPEKVWGNLINIVTEESSSIRTPNSDCSPNNQHEVIDILEAQFHKGHITRPIYSIFNVMVSAIRWLKRRLFHA